MFPSRGNSCLRKKERKGGREGRKKEKSENDRGYDSITLPIG